MHDFARWIQEDTANTPSVDFTAYLGVLILRYAFRARQLWRDKWLGKRKIKKLETLMCMDSRGQIDIAHLKPLDLLDFLAENLDDKRRLEWSVQCRRETKQIFELE